jgi:hypothetical protein
VICYVTDPADACSECAELRAYLRAAGNPSPNDIRCKQHRRTSAPYLDIGPASFCPDCTASTGNRCPRHSSRTFLVSTLQS